MTCPRLAGTLVADFSTQPQPVPGQFLRHVKRRMPRMTRAPPRLCLLVLRFILNTASATGRIPAHRHGQDRSGPFAEQQNHRRGATSSTAD
jgi:hypothetical protein